MNTSAFSLRLPSLLAFAGLMAATPLVADTEDNITRTFTAAPGQKLVVDVGSTSIDVRGGPGTEVAIEYLRRVSAGSQADEEEILRDHVVTIEQSGDTITIRSRGPASQGGSWWSNLWGSRSTRKFQLKVTVPEKFNVELKTSGGGIAVASLQGTVKANTSGGGLDFTGIAGEINGHTSGGGIDLDDCRGTIEVHTSGGGIKARHGEGRLSLNTSGGGITVDTHRGDVKAHTSGGGITCNAIAGDVDAHTSGGGIRAELTMQPAAPCRLSTSGGSVTVIVPANVAVNLDAETSGGSVHSELPVTVSGENKRNRLRGPINGGGPELHLRSSGGSIHVNEGPAADLAALER